MLPCYPTWGGRKENEDGRAPKKAPARIGVEAESCREKKKKKSKRKEDWPCVGVRSGVCVVDGVVGEK